MSARGPRVQPVHKDAIVIDDDGRRVEPASGVVGRLARGGHVPLGYYKDPEKTAALFVEVDGGATRCPATSRGSRRTARSRCSAAATRASTPAARRCSRRRSRAPSSPTRASSTRSSSASRTTGSGSGSAALVQWREGAEPDADGLDRARPAAARRLQGAAQLSGSSDTIERLASGKPDYGWAKARAEEHAGRRVVDVRIAGGVGPLDHAHRQRTGLRTHAHESLRPARHRAPDRRLHAVRARRGGDQPRRRARGARLRALQRPGRARGDARLAGREHRRPAVRRRRRDAVDRADRGHGGRPGRADPARRTGTSSSAR